jgi:hypothetical protein
LKVSKRSWHYRWITWAFDGESSEPFNVIEYLLDFFASVFLLPLLLLAFRVVPSISEWLDRHKLPRMEVVD